MNNFKRVSAAVLAGMALLCAPGASYSLGFGQPTSRTILGDSLRLTVPLRLDAGEEISNECVAADVYFGDDKVAPKSVFAEVLAGTGSERFLKVTTSAAVNEPVVTVYLAAGCKARITRKVVAFADPPGAELPTASETSPVSVAESIQAATLPAPAAVSPGTSIPPQTRSAGQVSARGQTHAQAEGSSKPSRSSKAPAHRPPSLVMADVVAAREVDQQPSPAKKKTSKAARPEAAAVAKTVAQAPSSRLELDPVDVDAMVIPQLHMTPTLGAALHAEDASPEIKARRDAAAAVWLALNASPEQMARDHERLRELEQRLAQLKQEGDQARQNATTLQTRLAQAESAPTAGRWLYALALLALAAIGLAAYLFKRLREEQQRNAAWWQGSDSSQPVDQSPDREPELGRTSTGFVHGLEEAPPSPVAPSPAPAAAPVTASAKAAAAKPTVARGVERPASPGAREAAQTAATAATTAATAATAAIAEPHHREPLREVSVEELIDLEQQAEFFVVLGQDDAAIDLLESHVQHTTGASPLPFLKLLEIYRRVGRRADYERVQSEFNTRFNAYAPAWDSDLQHGHTLEDYPGVIERLQGLWAMPSQAMEVLEKSLTRPESGSDTFELPAYRELLFLYAVARDLSERNAPERNSVDLLLPVVDVSGFEPSTSLHEAAVIEPLMATRPIRAQPEASPSLSLDLHLEDIEETKPPGRG